MHKKSQLNHKEQAVLDRIVHDEASKNYFFKKVAHAKWFYHLKDEGFFLAENAPGPEPAMKEGYFTFPEWNILSYLERISEQVQKGECEIEYTNELLLIISDVTNYCRGKEEVDNYRTWWYFAKILCNLPTNSYSVGFLDHIIVWLQSRFDNSLVVSELTEKLIPRLLIDEHFESIRKAEKLIVLITDINSVDRNYRFRSDTFRINKFFKSNSELIAQKCSSSVVCNLSSNIQKILEKQVSSRNIVFGTRTFDVELTNLPEKYKIVFKDSSADISQAQLEVFLDKESVEHFIEKLTDHITATPHLEYNSELTEKYLWALYNELYNGGSLQSLYDMEDDNSNRDSLQSATGILKKLLLDISRFRPEEIAEIVSKYFQSQYMYFVKMALYIIGMTGEKYEKLFWDALESKNSCKIFDSLYVEDELRYILTNLEAPSGENKALLIELIEGGPKYCWKSEDEDTRRYVAIWKQERYQALKHLPEFAVRYDELKKITGFDAALHPAIGKIQTRWGWGDSPLTPEEVLAMPNKELVAFLRNFKSKDRWNGPTVSALSQTLQNVAKLSPEKFSNDLSPFLRSGYLYVYNIFSGIQQSFNANKTVDWNKILFFIQQYTDKPDFWNDVYKISDDHDWNADHQWVINMTCELIKSGTNDDKRAISAELLNTVYLIIFNFAKKLSAINEKIVNDSITHILNSIWGKLLTALLYTALRQARIKKSNVSSEEVRWDLAVKEIYDDCFKRDSQDVYIVFGYYLPQFYYLDRRWAKEKLTYIFEREQRFQNLFASGYLNNSNIYADIFKDMGLFYNRAISEISDDADRKMLATHLATGYLYGLDDSNATELFFNFAEESTSTDIHNLLMYFWSKREDFSSGVKLKKRKKVMKFWEWLYKKYFLDNKFSADSKKILADTVMLAKYLDEINNQAAVWLEAAAEFVQEYHNSYLLVEILDELKDKGDRVVTAKYIARIFRKMLNQSLPDYDKTHLRSIFKFLVEVDDQEVRSLAGKISDIYLRKGYEIFVDIWEESNKSY